MIDDSTTFFLAFVAVFLGFGLYMLRLEKQARRLEVRVAGLEAKQDAAKPKSHDGGDHP